MKGRALVPLLPLPVSKRKTCDASLLSHVNHLNKPASLFTLLTFQPLLTSIFNWIQALFLCSLKAEPKMKRNLRSFCHGAGSTSTLDQRRSPTLPGSSYSPYGPSTLEEMIWQLELEEEAARRAKFEDYNQRRMSCVNNSDILRSARNALNQYPRFSLDGRDAMYRSSFRNLAYEDRRKSVCCFSKDGGYGNYPDLNSTSTSLEHQLPPTLAGERVVWCKPGVVAKLMGLEAMPVPLHKRQMNPKEQRPRNCRMKNEEDKMKRKFVKGVRGCRGPSAGNKDSAVKRWRSTAAECGIDLEKKGRHG